MEVPGLKPEEPPKKEEASVAPFPLKSCMTQLQKEARGKKRVGSYPE